MGQEVKQVKQYHIAPKLQNTLQGACDGKIGCGKYILPVNFNVSAGDMFPFGISEGYVCSGNTFRFFYSGINSIP